MDIKSGEEVGNRNPLSLFELSGAVVSSVMGHVEKEVWALPGPVLQGILPLLNIYYLERIEEIAVKKGLSTEPIWCRLWFDIMKTRPSRLENIKCWRKKFLETFFSNVLRGILDVSSHQRLSDPCFLPLLYTSRHITELTIYNMLEGVSELMAEHNQRVLENLAVSLRTLTFRHLLSSSLSTRRQLNLFLHRLIHHGAVNYLSMYSWPDPDPALLALILKMSAGIWNPGKTLMNAEELCHLCTEKSTVQSQKLDQECRPPLGSDQLFPRAATGQFSDNELRNVEILPSVPQEFFPGFENAVELSRTSNKSFSEPLDHRLGNSSYQSQTLHNASSKSFSAEVASVSFSPAKPSQGSFALGKSPKRRKAVITKKHSICQKTSKVTAEMEDLYDFVFTIAKEEEEMAFYHKIKNVDKGEHFANESSLRAEASSVTGMVGSEGTRPVGITSLKTVSRFRSVSTLEVFSIPLSRNTCQMLGNLLSSWVSLEKLILTLNGLGPGIFSILSGLRILSQRSDYCLRVVRISDMFAHVPCMNLVHSFLSAVPLLRVLLVSFDLKTAAEWNRLEEDMGSSSLVEKIPETYLEHLEIRFPREPLQTSLLVPVLKASGSLQSLSLDSVAISCPQEVWLLLQALKEYNPKLKKLSFHDVNLSGHSKEVLFLLQNPILQEINFSFCRLFENCTAELLTEMITAMKKNSSLTTLKLPGNRLGNHRLIALADIFAEDSSSSISHLDVSSNCIKPDGLLEFAKKLESYTAERRERFKFTKLCLYQNWLDQDAITAQEALSRLKAMCSVVSDAWDSSQAFADYISVM
ncbi:leucine-rich repeat-containing protein 41 isoform X1 [Candoia aspera]|uniref:leucine-rich repeat-containing protein 41 isoform X1 n=1 Tax=Candoia aspera TaxID=51853 RepID=UPI002FD7C58A